MESPTSTSQNCPTMHWTRHFQYIKLAFNQRAFSFSAVFHLEKYLLTSSLTFGESQQAAAKSSSVAFKACGYRVHEAVQRHQAIGSQAAVPLQIYMVIQPYCSADGKHGIYMVCIGSRYNDVDMI